MTVAYTARMSQGEKDIGLDVADALFCQPAVFGMEALQEMPVIPRVGRQEMEIPLHQFAKRSERREKIA